MTSFRSPRITGLLALCLLGASIGPALATSLGEALATAHPEATKAGAHILEAGGNAFDAAIAISASLGVVEPYGSGIGGGGFFLLHHAARDHTTVLDARERAPLAAHRDMYLDDTGAVNRDAALNGPLAAGIPGLAAAWEHLTQHYATLPLAQTLAPALQQAREGITVDPPLLDAIRQQREVLERYSASSVFLVSDVLIQPDLAQTLEHLSQQGAGAFYTGTLADTLIAGVQADGGIWSLDDLAQYRVIERDPITIEWQGAQIISTPLPSATGIMLAQIFQMLGDDWLHHDDATAQTHRLIEALRRSYLDRAHYLGDPDHQEIPVNRLMSPQHAHTLMADFDPTRASSSELRGPQLSPDGHTTHFSILDRHGNWVSATLSINGRFGSSYVVPGTGVLLNNEMDDFSAKPGASNLYGLIGSEANAIEPGKRMLSSMGPTAIRIKDRLALIGSPGGSRITTLVLHGIIGFLKGQDARSIVTAPRLHHQAFPDKVFAEAGAIDDPAPLESLGHTLIESAPWGNMQVVIRDQSHQLDAASDPRGIGSHYLRPPQR